MVPSLSRTSSWAPCIYPVYPCPPDSVLHWSPVCCLTLPVSTLRCWTLLTVQIQNFHWPHKLRILIKAIVCLFASIIIKTGTCIINFCIVHRSLVQNICYVQNRDKYHNPRGHSKSSHIINPGSSDMEFQSIRTVICLVTTSDSSRLVPTSLT